MTLTMAGGKKGMTRKQRRLMLIGIAGVVLAIAAGLVLYAMTDRIVFFNAPSDFAANPSPPGTRLRLGGLVAAGSVVRHEDGRVTFDVTDGGATVPVAYKGIRLGACHARREIHAAGSGRRTQGARSLGR
jgi:cytochrome c-type biogenesis protein CcmE